MGINPKIKELVNAFETYAKDIRDNVCVFSDRWVSTRNTFEQLLQELLQPLLSQKLLPSSNNDQYSQAPVNSTDTESCEKEIKEIAETIWDNLKDITYNQASEIAENLHKIGYRKIK